MKVYKSNHFKLTIENINFEYKNEKLVIHDWTGYGLILIPYVGWKPINRGTRKTKFNWMVDKKIHQIDLTFYLKSIIIEK